MSKIAHFSSYGNVQTTSFTSFSFTHKILLKYYFSIGKFIEKIICILLYQMSDKQMKINVIFTST